MPRPATPPVPLASVVAVIPEVSLLGDASGAVSGITHDSRAVRPGDLYCALQGANAHGADFLDAAVSNGAAAILTDDAGRDRCAATGLPVLLVADVRSVMGEAAACVYGYPASGLTMLGVTGTNGKTTTTYMLDAGLRSARRTTGLIGTIETRVGAQVLPSVRTTPESTDLHALLALMRERGADTVVMEVSSHALAMGRVDGVVFDVAGFTNLSQDHLDFHGGMEPYYAAKASLFTPQRAREGVVCVDDDWGRRLAREATIPVTQVSNAASASLVERNAALASAMAGVVGDDPVAAEAVARTVQVPGRLEPVPGPDGRVWVYVDYAHTPEAIDAVLRGAPSTTPPGNVVVVLGAGGDRDPSKRALMGAAAAGAARAVVVTDDNPRSEDPASIRHAVLTGARAAAERSGATVEEVGDRRTAIARGLQLAAEHEATLLVLGKGHEQGQEIAGEVHPFDDRVVARELLADEGAAQ